MRLSLHAQPSTRVILFLTIAAICFATEHEASWCQNGVIKDSACCPKTCGDDCGGHCEGHVQCCEDLPKSSFSKYCSNSTETACLLPSLSTSKRLAAHGERHKNLESARGLLQKPTSAPYNLCLTAAKRAHMPCQIPGKRSHIFHLHIAKMAGRTIMSDGPKWLELPGLKFLAISRIESAQCSRQLRH